MFILLSIKEPENGYVNFIRIIDSQVDVPMGFVTRVTSHANGPLGTLPICLQLHVPRSNALITYSRNMEGWIVGIQIYILSIHIYFFRSFSESIPKQHVRHLYVMSNRLTLTNHHFIQSTISVPHNFLESCE